MFDVENCLKNNPEYIWKIKAKINNDARNWSDSEIDRIFVLNNNNKQLSHRLNLCAKFIRDNNL